MTLTIKLDNETLGLLRSIEQSLRQLISPQLDRKRLDMSALYENQPGHVHVVDESAFSLNTPEFMVQEQLKDQAREQGWTPFKE